MSLSTNAPVDNVNSITTVTATHSDDISGDAASGYIKRQRGRTLQPGEFKVPADQAAALRGKALEQYLDSEQGRTLSAREQQVLRFLSSKANKGVHWIQDNRLCSDCFWQQKKIAAALGCKSEATIARAIKGLKAAGIVNSHRKRYVVNTYIVQLPLPTESVTKPTKAPVSKPAEAPVSKPTKLSLSLTSSSIQPSKKETTPTPTRTSEPTASANTSSIERGGGGGVISFEKSGRAEELDEQENERVSDAVEVLMCNGFNSRSQARTLVQSNKQITSEVVDYMLNSIEGTPENPIGIVRRKLQAPEDVQDVVDKLPKIKMLVERVERERQAAAARKAAEEQAEATRKHIEQLAIQRARQRTIALTDERLWCVWALKVAPALAIPEFNEQSLKNIRETIICGSSPSFDRSRIAAIVEKARAEELETLRQHVANGTAIEDLKNLPLKCDRDDDKERKALAEVQQHIELMKLTPAERKAKREAAAQARWAAERSIAATGGGK